MTRRARRRLTGLLLLAALPLVAEAPGTWSPASAMLVYTSGASGHADLWLKAGQDSEPRQLTRHEAQDHAASWFPGGERVAFQSLRDGQREIYMVAIDGSAPVRLTDHPAEDLLPAVSPDGRQVVFFSDRGLEHGPRELPGNLYLLDLDGGSVERLTSVPLTSTFGADWSPDGSTILFARDFGGDIDLVLLDLETRHEKRIPGPSAAEYGGRFSPDGRRIAFHAATPDGESRIVVAGVDGNERRFVTAGAQHYYPSWSPDGVRIVLTGAPLGEAQFDVLMVGVEGGELIRLVATDDDERSASWAIR